MTKEPDNEFDHPCRKTCSGWTLGYERGQKVSSERIDNQAIAIGKYQEQISNLEDRLIKHLEQNYTAPTFKAEVIKIFKEVMKCPIT